MEKQLTTHYTEKELAEFQNVIEKKLARAEIQLAALATQLSESSANTESHSDWVDDSSNSANLQLLDTMANRLKKHILDLKKALIRVQSKSYGICSITGILIDKKRLLAVPTTTKSLAAKNAAARLKKQKSTGSKINKDAVKKIISRVIKKKEPSVKKSLTDDDFAPEWEKEDHLLDDVEPLDLKEEELED